MTKPYYIDDQVTLHHGDALDIARQLEPASADCIVTSPPYFGLRDYGTDGQYGLEATPAEYVETMRTLFAELRRVLADDGTLWLNIGDSYSSSGGHTGAGANSALVGRSVVTEQNSSPGRKVPGMPTKNLIGIPWRVAFALQDDGWILRNAIIWNKPNAMPESVRDRLSGRYEHVFMFSKRSRYWFDLDPIREPHTHPARGGLLNRSENSRVSKATGTKQGNWDGQYSDAGRNPGDVWTLPTQPFPGAHFAVYPIALPQRCIQAGCKPGGTVLDPFNGSGTTGLAAQRTGRKYIGIDLNREYLDLTLNTRLQGATLDFGTSA